MVTLILFFSGCTLKENEVTISTNGATYSNLVDQDSQNILRKALADAGVPQTSIDVLLDSVIKYNNAVGSILPVQNGFEPFPDDYNCSTYSSDKLSRKWRKKYKNDTGRKNCRLTAFEAMGSLISYNGKGLDLSKALFVVELEDDSIFQTAEHKIKFTTLFSGVKSAEEDTPKMLSKRINEYWNQFGIQFPDNNISMISVVYNNPSSDGDESYMLHCGHVCVLIHKEDGNVLLLEKLGYNFPYQLIDFPSEKSALEYIVTLYFGEFDDSTTVLVNNKLLRKENNCFIY